MDIPCSSHQPLVKCLLEVLKPRFILELGVGDYSTPIFLASNFDKMLSIENDASWIEHVESKYALIKYFPNEIRHHDLGSYIDRYTFVKNLTPEKRREIESYYQELGKEISNEARPRLLFVDQYTCCRTISINELSPYFDVIIYHDCQPGTYGVDWYEYHFSKQVIDSFSHYQLQTPVSWTGCFINKELYFSFDELTATLQKHLSEYCKANHLSLAEWAIV